MRKKLEIIARSDWRSSARGEARPLPHVTIGAVKQSLENRVNWLIDVLIAKGSSDFVADFAYPLPSLVIFDLLGIPEEDHITIRDTAELFWQFPSAVYRCDVDLLDRIAALALRAEAVLWRLLEDRRISPKADLISALVRPEMSEEVIPDDDIIVMCIFLLMAGHETTVNLIGNGMLALLENPDQIRRLRDNPALIKAAIEELLRYNGPLETATERYTREDTMVAGVTVPRGELVFAVLASANRDERQFEDAGRGCH